MQQHLLLSLSLSLFNFGWLTLPTRFLLTTALVLTPISVKAEVVNLANPQWEEIPDTYNSAVDGAAYFDANGISQNGDILTYDVVNPDAGYTRLETNCATGESRSIRHGYFETATRVSFVPVSEAWRQDTTSLQGRVAAFICELVDTL